MRWLLPLLLLPLLLANCVQSEAVTCTDGTVCPANTYCIALDEGTACVSRAQQKACNEREDGASCSLDGVPVGICRSGGCFALDSCNYAGQQVDVPIVTATYLDALDDTPHGTTSQLWVTEQRTTLLEAAIGVNAISALTLFLAQVPDADCTEPCTPVNGPIRVSRVLVPWSAEATWTHRTATELWSEPGIGAADQLSLALLNTVGVSTALIPVRSEPIGERHLVSISIAALGASTRATYARTGTGALAARATCLRGNSCGNGQVDPGEQCDGTEFCSSTCTIEVCGNGVVEAGEGCDDGNLSSHDLCLNDCTAARCGDGFVANENGGTEQCDEGLQNGNGCCSANCTGSCP